MSIRAVRWSSLVLLLTGVLAIWLEIAAVREMNGGVALLSFLSVLPFGVAWLTGIVVCLATVRAHRRAATILGVLVMVTAVGYYRARELGWRLRDRDFESYRPALERTVARLSVLPDSALRQLDPRTTVPELPDRFYIITARRTTATGLSVWFFYGGAAFVPRHSAWLYVADASATKDAVMGDFWHRARPLRSHWYDASD